MPRIEPYHPSGMVLINDDPDRVSLSREPVFLDGQEFQRAQLLIVGKARAADELPGVIIMLGNGGSGLHVQFTPDGARELAHSLLTTANAADNDARPLILAQITGAKS